jgi:hypothetical protein
LGDGLDRSETVGLERVDVAYTLLLLCGHLGADTGSAVLAEPAGINGGRGDIVVLRLSWNTRELSGEVDFHLFRIRLDVGIPMVSFRAAHAMRFMSRTRRLVGIHWRAERIFYALAVGVGAVVAPQRYIHLSIFLVTFGTRRLNILHSGASGLARGQGHRVWNGCGLAGARASKR